jgi:hypothetical protein
MEVYSARVALLIALPKLLNLVFIRGGRAAPGGGTTGGTSGAGEFVQPGQMEDFDGDHPDEITPHWRMRLSIGVVKRTASV